MIIDIYIWKLIFIHIYIYSKSETWLCLVCVYIYWQLIFLEYVKPWFAMHPVTAFLDVFLRSQLLQHCQWCQCHRHQPHQHRSHPHHHRQCPSHRHRPHPYPCLYRCPRQRWRCGWMALKGCWVTSYSDQCWGWFSNFIENTDVPWFFRNFYIPSWILNQ